MYKFKKDKKKDKSLKTVFFRSSKTNNKTLKDIEVICKIENSEE